MRISNYTYLLLFALYLGFVYFTRKRKQRENASLFYSSVAPFAGIKDSAALRLANNTKYLKVAAIALILLALTRPQLKDVELESDTYGVDIVLSLDVSGSMLAEDFVSQEDASENRLTIAKDVLREFISKRHTDRLGLVVFAGKSYTQSPLTTDYNILLNILDDIKINHNDKGTAIGLAISESLNRLKNSNAKSRAIIILTDGENNKGSIDPVLAANLAKAIDVRVYTIGIGSAEGAAVPMSETASDYAKAADGSALISRLNEDGLKQIAQISGGAYFHATDKDTLLSVYNNIDAMEKSKIEMTKYFSYYELFPYFAFLALLLIFAEIVLTTTRYSRFP